MLCFSRLCLSCIFFVMPLMLCCIMFSFVMVGGYVGGEEGVRGGKVAGEGVELCQGGILCCLLCGLRGGGSWCGGLGGKGGGGGRRW